MAVRTGAGWEAEFQRGSTRFAEWRSGSLPAWFIPAFQAD
jgi:hypothetical protein